MSGRQGARITGAWFDEVRCFTPEVLRAIAPALAPLATVHLQLMLDRRERLIAEVAAAYGVTLFGHPRLAHVVVTSVSQWDTLRDAVRTDPGLDAIGRGYYLGLGGEVDVRVVPDWMCDPRRVSLLRMVVVFAYRPLSRLCRALSCLLALHAPGSCKPHPKEYR